MEALCALLREVLGVADDDDDDDDGEDGSETSDAAPLASGVDIIDVQFADAALPPGGHSKNIVKTLTAQ